MPNRVYMVDNEEVLDKHKDNNILICSNINVGKGLPVILLIKAMKYICDYNKKLFLLLRNDTQIPGNFYFIIDPVIIYDVEWKGEIDFDETKKIIDLVQSKGYKTMFPPLQSIFDKDYILKNIDKFYTLYDKFMIIEYEHEQNIFKKELCGLIRHSKNKYLNYKFYFIIKKHYNMDVRELLPVSLYKVTSDYFGYSSREYKLTITD